MTRRTHHKVEALPKAVIEQVNQLIAGGRTYRDIETILRDAGHDVGKSSVARYGSQMLTGLERLKAASEQVKAILGDSDGMDASAEEAVARVARAKLLDAMMSVEDLSGESFSQLVNALARLQTAGSGRARVQHLVNGAVGEAMARIKRDLAHEIQGDPELVARLHGLVDRAVGGAA